MSDTAIEHGTKLIAPDVRIHYAMAGKGPRTVVLIHGFPETWWQWRHILPGLAKAGWRAIAIDYRGAGNSSKPLTGFDKVTMAGDVKNLLQNFLGIKGPIAVVGHDIGAMVAYAYAAVYRNETTHLGVLDSIIPGTQGFARVRALPRVWHFDFHAVPDLPEFLIHGKEREYLRMVVDARIVDPAKFDSRTMEEYTYAYSAVGGMRCAFEVYRAFDRDCADNEANFKAHGKLKMPVVSISGAESPLNLIMESMMNEVAERVKHITLPGTSHWMTEEKPEETLKALVDFLD